MQRNNIVKRYPRTAKIQLVRWAEIGVDGVVLTPTEISDRAAEAWPELPRIHGTTWKAWHASAEYMRLRDLVCNEQQRNAFLDDEFLAVGGEEAFDDFLATAMYNVSRTMVSDAQDADNYKAKRAAMQTLRDAHRMRMEAAAAERDDTVAVLEREHDAACAQYEARIRELTAERDRLREALQAKLEASGKDRRQETIAAFNEWARGEQD